MLSALSAVERDIRWKKKNGGEQASKVYFDDATRQDISAPVGSLRFMISIEETRFTSPPV